jgi:hypothetical protein
MIPDADRDGFDPFREDYPEHDIKTGKDLINYVLTPWTPSDPPQPQPKQVKCGLCHKDFTSKASWFAGRWLFAGICLNCADGNTLPPGFLSECQRARIRQLSCPRCGISRGVEATLRHNLWYYELTCSHCGCSSTIVRRIRRTCVDCGEEFSVSDARPRKVCHKCDKKTSSGSGAY